MPYTKVFVHFVWATKNRFPFLDSLDLRKKVWRHITEQGRSKGIFVDTAGGYEEHCHCLTRMRPTQTMSEVMQLLKGESSHWINQNKLCKQKFQWQNDFFGESVSERNLDRVRRYINNQEEHHKKESFNDEYNRFIKKKGGEGAIE